jgi:hypothetical protein
MKGKKKHSRKWSAAHRANHAKAIAARKAIKAMPIGARPPGPSVLFHEPTPAPVKNGNGNGSRVIEAHGVADLHDAIQMMRSTGQGLVALANMLERMDRNHVADFVKGFGFRFDMRPAAEASPRPS